MKKCAVEETSGKHGKALAAGKHTIQYSVTDQAGLKGECMFKINIVVERKSFASVEGSMWLPFY